MDTTSPDPVDKTFRRRVITGILTFVGLVAGSFGPTYYELGTPLLAVCSASAALGSLVLAWRVNRGADVHRAAHLGVLIWAIVLTLDNLHTGGFFDPNFSWLYVIPIAAALLIGARAALGWTAVVLVITVAFWAEDAIGLPVDNHIPAANHAAQSLFNRVTTLVVLGAMGVIFVVERNRAHRALRDAVAEAEAANATSQVFLATMSHELRTPLNAILGYSELVREQVEAGEIDEVLGDLDRVERAGRHLLGLVDDVLTLSRLDAGALVIRDEPVRVGDAVAEACQTIRPLASNNGNTIEVHCEEGLVARADAFRLQQVLVNLLGNAAKFTHDGVMSLTAEARGDQIAIAIADTGIGIGPEQLERIFERFEQADDSTTRRFGGTGLGLAICRELTRSMNGEIRVASTLGVGTAFTVALPLLVSEQEAGWSRLQRAS